mmetsp:Transcript_139866/g.389787  ORF Transcript_139866/g.389787 Transcript_139866/m.389787 type:complete len:220 (-) Transcript_139866:83-742(-)
MPGGGTGCLFSPWHILPTGPYPARRRSMMLLWESASFILNATSRGLSLSESFSILSAPPQSNNSTSSALAAFVATCSGYVYLQNSSPPLRFFSFTAEKSWADRNALSLSCLRSLSASCACRFLTSSWLRLDSSSSSFFRLFSRNSSSNSRRCLTSRFRPSSYRLSSSSRRRRSSNSWRIRSSSASTSSAERSVGFPWHWSMACVMRHMVVSRPSDAPGP